MAGNCSKNDESVVYLGYIEDGDIITNELTEEQPSGSEGTSSETNDAESPWLVNKIGGIPIFPSTRINLKELEECLESMKCKHCKTGCVLVFQLNSPIDDSPYDRVMHVYTCVKSDCIKHSWFALRCMFARENLKDIEIPSNESPLEQVQDHRFGSVLVCRTKAFFKPYYVSVIEEPTGRENFTKNNLEALKLAAKFTDPDLKPAPIEEKYKNLKNYKPPKPPAHLSDLEDFEKFQMEKLYGGDKDMYRFYKRVARYQAQVVRYDWEGVPLVNSSKVKFSLQVCPNCSSKRKFEFQIMSALINYLEAHQEFDRESLDFSSIVVHSCSKNCYKKNFNLEDTYFMPDPDSRIFNKVKHRMLAMKLSQAKAVEGSSEKPAELDDEIIEECEEEMSEGEPSRKVPKESAASQSKNKKKKNKKNKKR